jgi:hypothetical protein
MNSKQAVFCIGRQIFRNAADENLDKRFRLDHLLGSLLKKRPNSACLVVDAMYTVDSLGHYGGGEI